MTFINPIELLDLKHQDVSAIDNILLKKAKRRIQAEIELSEDGTFNFDGKKISKSDAERLINDLEDQDKLEYYHFIANYPALSTFLSKGDKKVFDSFRQESIYKNIGFLDFVSPFFAEQYDKVLSKSFQAEEIETFQKIISISPIVTANDLDKAYRSLFSLIKEKIKEVDDLTSAIKNNESIYDEYDIDEVEAWVRGKLDLKYLNFLPSYFQSLRNQAAQSIRNLSVNIFNTFGTSQLALDIIDYALKFNIDGLTKQKLTNDYNQIDSINERQIQARYGPILKKYASVMIDIKSFLDRSEKKEMRISNGNVYVPDKEKTRIYKEHKDKGGHINFGVNGATTEISEYLKKVISVSELNSLSEDFSEIRNQIALSLKALSVSIWNNYTNINASLFLVNLGLQINISDETRSNLTDAKKQLNELKIKIDLAQQASYQSTNTVSSTNTSDSYNSNLLIILGVTFLLIIGFIIAISNSNKKTPSDSSNENSGPTYSDNTHDNVVAEPKKESKYKDNQLKNGISPLDGCFGKGKYAGQAWVKFENANLSDAIVCLVKLSTGKTIRNEYIRAGTNFTMSNIPSGTYYLKVYYGNDWNPTLQNFCGTKGAFETDAHFSKSDNFEVENSEYSITLKPVPGGNMSSQPTSEADFFNN